MKREAKTRDSKNPPEATTPHSSDVRPINFELPFRSWLLGAMTALFVARPLVPSEGVAWLGDGQPFCMMWLLLALATSFAAIKAKGLPRRFGAVELLVVLFVLLHSVAALSGASFGSPRPSYNMLWEGVAMAICFLLVRQLVLTSREVRVLVAIMISLAVVLSVDGLYQVFVGLPADRAAYARDPEGMLRAAGQWHPPGSPARLAFESRLNSTEPLATFALTNSLAGFLVTWLVVALPWGLRWKRLLVPLGILATCLVLTKSRSAYLAGVLGAVIVLVSSLADKVTKSRALLMTGISVAVIVGVALGARFDSKILTEAGKSLEYRLQYWEATAAMIQERPLLGVGPGNFQDFYTQYKRPEASEEIRDPHNWAFEIAATAGIPALILFCASIGVGLWKMIRPSRLDSARSISEKWVLGGAMVAFFVAFVVGQIADLPLGFEKVVSGLIVASITILLLQSAIRNGSVAPWLLAVGVATLLVNLLAAGGIMYPSVAGSLWLLIGLGINLAEPITPLRGKAGPLAALALCAVLTISHYLTGYSPVLRCQGAMLTGYGETGNIVEQEKAFQLAAALDPRSAEPWQHLAGLKLRLFLDRGGARTLADFDDFSAQFLARKPHSSAAYRTVGNWWQQVFAKTQEPEHASKAVHHLKRAVELYPNHAVLRAELALALENAGEPAMAHSEATKALELDAATPHADKKLSTSLREEISTIADKSPSGSR
jgi:hypothetical protein